MTENSEEFDIDQMIEVANRIGHSLELRMIRTMRCEAQVLDWHASLALVNEDDAPTAQVSIGTTGDDTVAYRLVFDQTYNDAEGTPGARVLIEVIVAFDTPKGFAAPENELAAFGMTTVVRLVHPYYREALSSSLSRIGATPMLIGLLKYGTTREDDPEAE